MDKYKEMALGSIGIYSVDEKRERIVTEEVKATNDFVDFIYNGMVQERENSIKKVNEKWGHNIKLRESYVENVKDEQDLEARGVKLESEAEASAEPEKEVKDDGSDA